MAGLVGVFRPDGDPRPAAAVAALLSGRTGGGEERARHWHDGPMAMGVLGASGGAHGGGFPGLLAHPPSGCVILADARLDDLFGALARHGRTHPGRPPSAAEALLSAYLALGPDLLTGLAGEFAFALWDRRERTLLLGRDPLGGRPLYVHQVAGRLVAFGSRARDLLRVPGVPETLDEGRIADFLVDRALEGVDATCTFFREIRRVPAGTVLGVTPEGERNWRFRLIEPGPTLRLGSDEAYAEAFMAVFSRAVGSRLEGDGRVGATLSGGIDSGAVSAVAASLLADRGAGPLSTLSAVGPDPDACPETRAVTVSLANPRFAPSTVSHAALGRLARELEAMAWASEEPFDGYHTLLRAVYLLARERGLTVVLDGAGADPLLGGGSRIPHLLRRGQVARALREARGLDAFWGGALPAPWQLVHGARTAFIPEAARRVVHRLGAARTAARAASASFISPDLAHRADLPGRFIRYADSRPPGALAPTEGANAARYVTSPDAVSGLESHRRVARAAGVEARDPFQDLEVVRFCLSLPGSQMMGGGWPKVVLRRATAGLVPDGVRWRRGKEHLGWAFTEALIRHLGPRLVERLEERAGLLAPFVRLKGARSAWEAYASRADDTHVEKIFDLAVLAAWLEAPRPSPGTAQDP